MSTHRCKIFDEPEGGEVEGEIVGVANIPEVFTHPLTSLAFLLSSLCTVCHIGHI